MQKALKALFLAVAALLAAETAALAYPDEPVRIVVPNAAGGSTDSKARLISQHLAKKLGVPVTVGNVAGGGTSIGARQVRDAEPDGHTVLFIHQALLTASAMGVADFGPEAFDVIAQTGSEYYALMVNASSPFMDMDDLIEAAKANPGTIRFGGQIGTISHFDALDLASTAGVSFRFVNTGGGAETRAALLGNHIDVSYVVAAEAKSLVEAGDTRLLAILAPERLTSMPDVPSAREQGYDVVQDLRYWWWMPRGVPAERIERFTQALEEAMKTPELVEALEASDFNLQVKVGPETQTDVEAEFSKIEDIAKGAGLN